MSMESLYLILFTGLTALGTLLLAFVAVFQDSIKYFFYKPKIELICSNLPPCRQIIAGRVWFKLKIKNVGDTTAKNCYVKITQIFDDRFNPLPKFEPVDLSWSIYKPVETENIASGSSTNIPFMSISENVDQEDYKEMLIIDKYGKKVGYHLKGENHKFYAFIYGDNIKPIRNIIEYDNSTNENKKIRTY